MKLMRTDILFLFALLFSVYVIYFLLLRNRFFNFVKDHWLKKGTFWDKIHLLFYLSFWVMMIIAVADIRGPEEKVNVEVPDQKTIIIIDTSLSMLVEDVRPSRLEKAIIVARHFVKNTYNGQTSIVLFSDNQKKYVPFTDDIDLLDAKLSALSDGNIAGGGSNLNQALMESIGYLKEFSNGDPVGNILVLTDGEDHDPLKFNEAYDKVALAVVGVGTVSGGPIPLRDEQKRFIGHKEIHGEKIISKLDEEGIKALSKNFKTFQYWIATSYSLPTDEISDFFNASYEKHLKDDSMTMRPVYSHYAVVLAVAFMLLSVVFFNMRTFKAMFCFALMTMLCFPVAKATDGRERKIIQVNENDPNVDLLEKFKTKNITRNEKIFLASQLLEKNDYKNAQIIYDEVGVNTQSDSYKNVYNYGISLLGSNETEKGLNVLKTLEVQEKAKGNTELADKINRNVLHFMLQSMKQKEQKREQEKQDEENKKKSKDQKSGNGEDKKDSKGNGQNDQANNGQQGKPQQGENEKDKDKEKNKDKNAEQEKKDQNPPESMAEKEKRERQRRAQVKIPALLKQLLSEDKNLQKAMFNTMNTKQHQLPESKDW